MYETLIVLPLTHLFLCSEVGAPSGFSPDMEAKERQQALYNAVCEPIIRRALLLLQLAPAPIQTAPSAASPMKILPGISMATNYGELHYFILSTLRN